MRTRPRNLQKLVRTATWLASSALVFQAGGCASRESLLGALADSIALAVAAGFQTIVFTALGN